jgi:hypothetical protein
VAAGFRLGPDLQFIVGQHVLAAVICLEEITTENRGREMATATT